MAISTEQRDVLRERTASKVLWGEREELIIEFLRDEGLGGEEIVDLLEEAKAEQKKIIRSRGIRKLILVSSCLLIFSALPIFYYFRTDLLDSMRSKVVVTLSIFGWTTCLAMIIRTALEMAKGKSESGATLQE